MGTRFSKSNAVGVTLLVVLASAAFGDWLPEPDPTLSFSAPDTAHVGETVSIDLNGGNLNTYGNSTGTQWYSPACVSYVVTDAWGNVVASGNSCTSSYSSEGYETTFNITPEVTGPMMLLAHIVPAVDPLVPEEDGVTTMKFINVTGGGSCAAKNKRDQGIFELRGVAARFPLGNTADGKSAGMIVLENDDPDTDFDEPAELQYYVENDAVEVIRDANDVLLQIKTPSLLVDIDVTPQYGYDVDFYYDADVGSKSGDEYTVNDQPYVKWEVRWDGNDDELGITKLHYNGTSFDETAYYLYEWISQSAGEENWAKTTKETSTGSVMQYETMTWASLGGTPEVLARTHMAKTASAGLTLAETVDEYTEYDFGRRQTKQKVKYGSGANDYLSTTWVYNDDDEADEYGTLMYVLDPDGGWVWHVVDVDTGIHGINGFDVYKISGWLDETLPASAPTWNDSDVRSVILSYGTGVGLESVKETIDGNIVRYATYADATVQVSSEDRLQRTVTRYLDTGGTTTYADVTVYMDETDDFVDTAIYADGRMTDHNYGWIASTPYDANGVPTSYTVNSTKTNDDDYRYEEVLTGLESSGSLSYVEHKSTKEVTITDAAGRMVVTESYVCTDDTTPTWTRINWTTRDYDEETGASTLITTCYSNGTSSTSEGCCGTHTETSRDGVVTYYEEDVLGRPTDVIRYDLASTTADSKTFAAQAEISTEYVYNVNPSDSAEAGWTRVTMTGDGAPDLVSETFTRHDLAGRIVAARDAAELTTTYAYDDDWSDGDRDVTVTDPSGATTITSYYRDGQVKSVAGTAVVGKYYDYGSNASNERWAKTATGTSLASPRYETAYKDMLGRADRAETRGWAAAAGSTTLTTSYTYDDTGGTGWLSEVSRPGLADTLYEYDSMGAVVLTGLDVDQDGELSDDDSGSADRLTQTQRVYLQDGSSNWWAANLTWRYRPGETAFAEIDDWSDLSSFTRQPDSISRRRLTGLTGGVVSGVLSESVTIDAYGNETTSETVLVALAVPASDIAAVIKSVVDAPDSSTDAVQYSYAGRTYYSTDKLGLTTSFGYDVLGRRTTVTDPRSLVTTTAYDTYGRVSTVTDDAGNVTTYGYYTSGHPGKLQYVKAPTIGGTPNGYTYYDYDNLGHTTKVWGDAAYPTLTEYDSYGQRQYLTTFQDDSTNDFTTATWPAGVDAADGDTTTWAYHAATGLLESKTDAASEAVAYTYTSYNQLDTRTWARGGGATDYGYHALTGELTSVNYPDATTDLAYAYDRLGRMTQVTDAAGTRTFDYEDAVGETPQLVNETFTSGLFSGLVREPQYASTGVIGRYTGVQVDVDGATPTTYEYEAGYDYDTRGRFDTVTGPGLPAGGEAIYTWTGSTPGPSTRVIKNSLGSALATSIYTYDADGNVLASVENKWVRGVTGSMYAYDFDARWRPTYKQRTGTAFDAHDGDLFYEQFGYNDRSELTATDFYDTAAYPSGTADASMDREYDYDGIGNRTESTEGSAAAVYYCTNVLNQYTTLDDAATCPATTPTVEFDYDDDGNLIEDADFDFTYDAENRLATATTKSPTNGDKKLAFAYDYKGRRVSKSVYVYDSGWPGSPDETTVFVWDGWRLLAELDGEDSNACLRLYTWGLDVSHTLQGAGTIGGLIAVQDEDAESDYVYFHDALGNVGQVVELGVGPVAMYEYDAYGNVTTSSGAYASTNPFRFSTKYWDNETGFGYWGYRYYRPDVGRWINRDPIGEQGGFNLYTYGGNTPASGYDPDGRIAWVWVCCPACILSLALDFGAGVGGCLWECDELEERFGVSKSECFWGCISAYGEDRMDHTDLYNLYKSAVEVSSCVCCGIAAIARLSETAKPTPKPQPKPQPAPEPTPVEPAPKPKPEPRAPDQDTYKKPPVDPDPTPGGNRHDPWWGDEGPPDNWHPYGVEDPEELPPPPDVPDPRFPNRDVDPPDPDDWWQRGEEPPPYDPKASLNWGNMMQI